MENRRQREIKIIKYWFMHEYFRYLVNLPLLKFVAQKPRKEKCLTCQIKKKRLPQNIGKHLFCNSLTEKIFEINLCNIALSGFKSHHILLFRLAVFASRRTRLVWVLFEIVFIFCAKKRITDPFWVTVNHLIGQMLNGK